MRVHDILKKPVITEKALSGTGENVYVFIVDTMSSKGQIKEAIQNIFNVEVATIKTLIKKGKTRRTGRKMKAKSLPDVKKAYITLRKGTIDVVPKA